LQRWLTEDVVHIIEDRERTAFEALQSDEERKRFIEQFWERRDPTPGTPENEVKEEHYRRIAWTNGRYGSAFEGSAPGWRTERGRFYIIHGPPDEIESHPSGGTGRFGPGSLDPWELWIYRPANGQAEIRATFIQPGGVGDYHLVEQ
jgi:GWxTD domain-containing protein